MANPDFEDLLYSVPYWMVEFEKETGIPIREVGLDGSEKAILKMPYKGNYGYWIDNNLLLNDFKQHFDCFEIDKEKFEEKWDSFVL